MYICVVIKKQNIMNITELTPGFIFYDATADSFMWYEYVCQMPVKNPTNADKYFIIIDKRFEKPIRIWCKDLEKILDKKLFTLKDAIQEELRLAKDRVLFLESQLEKQNNI